MMLSIPPRVRLSLAQKIKGDFPVDGITRSDHVRIAVPDEVLKQDHTLLRRPKQCDELGALAFAVVRIIVEQEMLLIPVNSTLFYAMNSQLFFHEWPLPIHNLMRNVTSEKYIYNFA